MSIRARGEERADMEGVLKKYTNLLRGWQSRYFVLDPETGQLHYYLNEFCKDQQTPQGSLALPGALVVSSHEFPHMFTVRSTNGDFYKLRALDARDQEMWVSRLQLLSAGYHGSAAKDFAKTSPSSSFSCFRDCFGLLQQNRAAAPSHINRSPVLGQAGPGRVGSDINSSDSTWNHQGKDFIQNQIQSQTSIRSVLELEHPVEKAGLSSSSVSATTHSLTEQELSVQIHSSDQTDHRAEITDSEDSEQEDWGVKDDERNIITHLLSQVKLGMDLTQVVLPTFILERHSLLEMYANFMAHPDMFLSITSGCSAEERIIRFVQYYLTAFHEGRKGAVAKKPYNPILGENFHCSWSVPQQGVPAPPLNGNTRAVRGTNDPSSRSVHFVAEQVSHHPPVSAFYCECKEKQMCLNAHVWTRSKFAGMSVGVSMVGEGVLYLLEHNEEYVFTLPCAYARSILTVPWMELGGKVSICCAKSGYSASITFHTKPLCGGKIHRVTAEVIHNQSKNLVCKVQGEWNGTLEFSYKNGNKKVIDTSKLPVIKKRIRPLEKQDQNESRRLWQHVTASLKAGDMEAATEHKHFLEEKQRNEEKQRIATKTTWTPKYFIKEGEGWTYHSPLWKPN